MPLAPLLEHKNADFVIEMPENVGFGGQKRTKTPILCSKSPKTWVLDGKSAQKCRFCAREARKWGFRRVKAHKNIDFVLGRGARQYSEVASVSDLAHRGVAYRGVAHRGVPHQFAGAYWPDAGEVLVISLPITSRSSVTLSRLPLLNAFHIPFSFTSQ